MKTICTVATVLMFAGVAPVAGDMTVSFDISQLAVDNGAELSANYPGCQPIQIGSQGALPARAVLLPLGDHEDLSAISASTLSSFELGYQLQGNALADEVTSDFARYDAIELERNLAPRPGSQPMTVTGQVRVEGQRYAELLLFPATVNNDNELVFHSSIEIRVGNRIVALDELLDRDEVLATSFERNRPSAASSGEAEYVIVTSAALADAMQDLVVYKNETGYVTELRLIDNILASYTGRDDAEKLREYLKTFYAAGGRYVLLAGDETVLPIRYAYPNTALEIQPLAKLQVCDLYFADMTGDWNADNDGTWGEKYYDEPDQIPELMVGRLPINTAEEAANYVAKLIRYEINPGGSDRSYLERAMFFSSDQMRDYNGIGQHNLIAGAYPDWFHIDTTSAVEQADGSDAAPTNLMPNELTPILQDGFGIINVIAHGRSDGFVLKSSGYNNWPKTYMMTNASSDHGTFEAYSDVNRPAFYYSLACDNGGFDLDQPPSNHTTPNMAQELIGGAGGAVGFVAYSRWGWITSSHLLQTAFFDSLFAHPERPAIEAHYAAKAELHYYTDLVYGLNFFGDPTLKVYAQVPPKPEMNAQVGQNGLNIKVKFDGAPAETNLVLAEDGVIIGEFATDQNGDYTIAYDFEESGQYRISSIPTEGTIAQIDFVPSIVADVDDDIQDLLPMEFGLHQNYPNPFNPSTSIAFDLPRTSPVRLTVFNILGQVASTLIDEPLPPGNHEIEWQAVGDSGERLSSGIYFYRIETDFGSETKKMILLK